MTTPGDTSMAKLSEVESLVAGGGSTTSNAERQESAGAEPRHRLCAFLNLEQVPCGGVRRW